MSVMTAVGWIGVMFLIGALVRAKVKFIGNTMIPACLIGGILGCILINTVGLPWTTLADYSTISGQMYSRESVDLINRILNNVSWLSNGLVKKIVNISLRFVCAAFIVRCEFCHIVYYVRISINPLAKLPVNKALNCPMRD